MLEQFKLKKKKLEAEILILIQNFEKETGTYIANIDILHNVWQTVNSRNVETIEVKADIKI